MQKYTLLEYIKTRHEAHQGKPDTKPIHSFMRELSGDMQAIEAKESGQDIVDYICPQSFRAADMMKVLVVAYKVYCKHNGYRPEPITMRKP